jgi:F-type H+-transporting ATPase subunit delta
MSNTKISKRYAIALFEFSQEEKIVEDIYADMAYIQQLCNQSKDFVAMLKSPVIKVAKKIEIMAAVLNGKVSEVTMRFLGIISKSRREFIIPSLADQFILMYKDSKGLKEVNLFSATKLPEAVIKEIAATMEKQIHKTIEINESIDEDLIGGFIIKMDDQQFDGSIKTKLARLKNVLEQQV